MPIEAAPASFAFEMEDLKLDEDDLSGDASAVTLAAHGPSPFGVGPLPRALFFRETGVAPWRTRTGKRIVVKAAAVTRRRGEQAQSQTGPGGGCGGGGGDGDDEVHVNEPKNTTVVSVSANGTSDEVAEDHLINRTDHAVTPCKLRDPVSGAGNGNPAADPTGLGVAPGFHNGFGLGSGANGTRSTFLMVFSPDHQLIASTHGDHNVYVSRVTDGECVKVLSGHPRTPWCVAFHPSLDYVLASGCLGGHVRLWDLRGGGSELWKAEVVIASLAFHPIDRLLVIATYNELHFWDWSESAPFAVVKTKNEKEKVRYVKFDAFGHTLITGIANLSLQQQQQQQFERIPCPHLRASSSRLSAGPTSSVSGRFVERYDRPRRHWALSSSSLVSSEATQSGRAMSPSALASQHHRRRLGQTPANAYPSSTVTSAMLIDRGTDPMLPSTSASRPADPVVPVPSASQTLSDLAQAATNQLMAERSVAAAPAVDEIAPSLVPLPHLVGSEARSGRSDALLASEPRPVSHRMRRSSYTMEWVDSLPYANPWDRLRSSASASGGVSASRNREPAAYPPGPPPPMDHSYVRRELRDRMRELARAGRSGPHNLLNASSTGASSTFSHSPESEFVAVGSGHPASRSSLSPSPAPSGARSVAGGTEVYLNPERTPSREANLRFQNTRDQRLRDLLDRREYLVNQIERLRSAREMLVTGNGRRSESAGRSGNQAPLEDHNYGVASRPIDDWALNRIASFEMEAASAGAVPQGPQAPAAGALNGSDAANIHELSGNSSSAMSSANDRFRIGGRNVFHGLRPDDEAMEAEGAATPEELQLPTYERMRSGPISARYHQLRHGYHHRNPSVLVLPRRQRGSLSASANSTTPFRHGSATLRLRLGRERDQDREPPSSGALDLSTTTPVSQGATPTSYETPARSATEGQISAATTRSPASTSVDQSNQDIALLSRHIEVMQRICREICDTNGAARERRHAIRLQSIRRMLEDLQRQIRSLRAASAREMSRRTREAEDLSALGNRINDSNGGRVMRQGELPPTRTSTTLTSSTAAARLRQRSTATLARLAAGSGQTRHGLSSTLSRRAAAAAAASSTGGIGARIARRTDALCNRRARLNRARNQLVSQLRATFRAMEMSPDLSRQANNPVSLSRAEESRNVMERTAQEATVINSQHGDSPRNELRAMSQRIERLLRSQREAAATAAETETGDGDRVDAMPADGGDSAIAGPEFDSGRPSFLNVDAPAAASSFLDDPYPRELRPRRSEATAGRRSLSLRAGGPLAEPYSSSHLFVDSSTDSEDTDSDRHGNAPYFGYTPAASSVGVASRVTGVRRVHRQNYLQQQGSGHLPSGPYSPYFSTRQSLSDQNPGLVTSGDFGSSAGSGSSSRDRASRLRMDMRRAEERERRRSNRDGDISRRRRRYSR